MFSSPARNILFLFVCLAITLFQIVTRTISLVSLGVWLLAIFLLIATFWEKDTHEAIFPLDNHDIVIIALFSALFVSILTLIDLNPEHYHRDEFILAYTSYDLPPLSKIDWFDGYPKDWVAQFPIVFHILQKPFLTIFGPSIQAMRMSTLPYCLLILWYLYFLAKLVISKRVVLLALIVYIFLACNLYITSYALHHITSAFLILACLYHILALWENKNANHAVFLGIYIGLSYLTYPGSYMNLPLIIMLGLLAMVRSKSKYVAHSIMVVLFMFLIILYPFIMHNIFIHPYFFDQYNNVNLLTGNWSNYAVEIKQGHSIISILYLQLKNTLMALIFPDIGGNGGYYFANQALFDPFAAFLLLAGLFITVKNAMKKHGFLYLSLLVTILFGFVTGYVLTNHPPAFHRLSVLFPLFAIVIAIGITAVVRIFSFGYRHIRNVLLCIILIIYILFNMDHLRTMIVSDIQDYPYSTRLAKRIEEVLPKQTTVTIGAYYGFHMGKELLFRTQNAYYFVTDDKDAVLRTYVGRPLLFINPTQEEIQQLTHAFPDNTMETYDNTHGESMAFFYPPPE